MRSPNPIQVEVVNLHRRFVGPVEDQDFWRKPLGYCVHRWFKSPNICDLYLYRQPEDFARIGARLLGRV